MSAMVVVFAVTTLWMLYSIGNTENERKENLKQMEHKFLIGMAWTETYKYQVQTILKLVYEKAAESDPQFIQDYENILKASNEKFELFANEWIKNMNETLGYKTEYQNWSEATKYIERLLKATKNESQRTKTD